MKGSGRKKEAGGRRKREEGERGRKKERLKGREGKGREVAMDYME